MGRLTGMSPEDYELAKGSRDLWTPDTLKHFICQYGERKIQAFDLINRRSAHVWGVLINWTFIVPFVIPTGSVRVTAVLFYNLVKVIIVTFNITASGLLGLFLFVGARVRDGKFARWNNAVVHVVQLGFFPLIMLIMQSSHVHPEHQKFLLAYSFQPVAWGDAAAEIIGSLFGKHSFQVSGLGEINKKTWEGCAACWVASFISCYVIGLLPGFPTNELVLAPMTLHLVAASVGTVLETVCFRSTDNGFMVLAVELLVIYSYQASL